MNLKRVHNRNAGFTEAAEAFAIFALNCPAATAADMRLEEENRHGRHYGRACVWIDGQPVNGYVKSTNRVEAAAQVLGGSLATLIGAPSTPCMLLTGCVPHTNMKRIFEQDDELRLFSATPFDDCEGGECFDDLVYVDGDPLTSGQAGQYRALINDKDTAMPNFLRCRSQRRTVCLFDHEDIAPQLGINHVAMANYIFISVSTPVNGPDKNVFIDAATDMARVIYHFPDKPLDALAARMKDYSVPAQPDMICGLKARRPIFERPIRMPRRINPHL